MKDIQEQMVEAVERLATATGRQFHVSIQMQVDFYAHRQGVEIKFVGYVENGGHVGFKENIGSVLGVEMGLNQIVDPEKLIDKARELEAAAERCRRLARKAGGE